MAGSAGYILGLMLGGYLAQQLGWRATFIIFGLSGFLLVPLTERVVVANRLPR